MEALLIRPGEGSHHTAADRLTSLITCPLPRAELTPLAYRHMENADDALADSLASAQSNYEKVKLVENHRGMGNHLDLAESSDLAAQNRTIAISADPAEELGLIKTYAPESLRRLYNQRNTVDHSGSRRSAALGATTRTALSLAGAELDRILHAQIEALGDLAPLNLVVRAETELRLVGTLGGQVIQLASGADDPTSHTSVGSLVK